MTIRVRLLRPQGGFSLIELAIVVLLVSTLLTMGIGAFSAQQESAAYSSTLRKQEYIKDALVSYLRSNRRLPCPETTGLPGAAPVTMLGREARSNGTPPDPAFPCSSYVGSLPWLDLGLAKDIALDGYGNFFTYYVASAAADADPDWTRTASPGVVTGFSVGSPGRFAITQNGIATNVDTSLNPLPALAVVVLVSHGKNGNGAITEKGTRNVDSANASELANQPPTAVALAPAWSPQQAPYLALNMLAPAVTKTLISSVVAGVAYDDIVLALRPFDLITPLIKDGAMKSPQAQISDSFARIKIALASYAFATSNPPHSTSSTCNGGGTAPYCRLLPAALGGMVPTASLAAHGLAPSDGFDPWGSPIRYVPSIATSAGAGAGLSQGFPVAGNAYTLASDGPDRAPGNADDVSMVVSLTDLRNMIGMSNLP
jgi:type II secretory pathway pseudopilin PulG